MLPTGIRVAIGHRATHYATVVDAPSNAPTQPGYVWVRYDSESAGAFPAAVGGVAQVPEWACRTLDVPAAEADLRPDQHEDVGGLGQPSPPPRPALTEAEQALEKAAAEVAEAVATRESGSRNGFGGT